MGLKDVKTEIISDYMGFGQNTSNVLRFAVIVIIQ